MTHPARTAMVGPEVAHAAAAPGSRRGCRRTAPGAGTCQPRSPQIPTHRARRWTTCDRRAPPGRSGEVARRAYRPRRRCWVPWSPTRAGDPEEEVAVPAADPLRGSPVPAAVQTTCASLLFRARASVRASPPSGLSGLSGLSDIPRNLSGPSRTPSAPAPTRPCPPGTADARIRAAAAARTRRDRRRGGGTCGPGVRTRGGRGRARIRRPSRRIGGGRGTRRAGPDRSRRGTCRPFDRGGTRYRTCRPFDRGGTRRRTCHPCDRGGTRRRTCHFCDRTRPCDRPQPETRRRLLR